MADQYPPAREVLRELGAQTHTLTKGSVLWRIHFTASKYVTAWNHLRTWGPVVSSRWDPHPLPPSDQAPLGIAYLGNDVGTCLAEVFQLSRFIDVDLGAPYLTGFHTARHLTLLDLTGPWMLKAGGSAQVALGEKARTRAWAQAIHHAWPSIDGISAPSAMIGGRTVTALWTARAFPAAPNISVPLNSPAIIKDIATEALNIGYGSNLVF